MLTILRLIALLTIVLSCTAFGAAMARRYTYRPGQLRAFHQVLAALEIEISYGATPLPEALRIAVSGVSEEVRSFFCQVADQVASGIPAASAWLKCSEESVHKFYLTTDDWKIIRSTGVGLGTTDRTEEKKKLKLSGARLLAAEEQALEQSIKFGRLWRYMGFLAGSALALVIW